MNVLRRLVCVAAVATLVCGVRADIIFSNVVIAGTLSSGASFSTTTTDIDFRFPDAVVGDPVAPRRFGNIIITYEAESTVPLGQDRLILSVLGALEGSGTIFVNEVVEDMIQLGVVATHNVVLDKNSKLPYVDTLMFARPTTRIKVKKTFFFSAIDTPATDLASVNLIQQLVPEPAPAFLAAGLLALAASRRRQEAR